MGKAQFALWLLLVGVLANSLRAQPTPPPPDDASQTNDTRPDAATTPPPPPPPTRGFGRLARVPSMFGDFFGSGSSQIVLPVTPTPGILDGTSGTARFVGATATGDGSVTNYRHPGSSDAVRIDIPGLITITGTNAVPFDIDINGTPPPAISFAIPDNILAVVNSVTNSPPVVAQYLPVIEDVEQDANPGSVLVSAGVTVGATGSVEAAGNDFDLVFPFSLSTRIALTTSLLNVPSPASGGAGVGRQKIAENGSPIPRHRVFVNYSYFDNVPIYAGGVNIHRVVPGFEKTFWDDQLSLEARFPFASTLDSDILVDGFTSRDEILFGNVTLNVKALLLATDRFALAGGLGVALPTADDVTVSQSDGTQFVRIENESVHLMPFIGFLDQPSKRTFVQAFLQIDTDLNGNPVAVNTTGNGPSAAGRINDVTFLFADLAVGYWMYRSATKQHGIVGIAPTIELHYNRGLQDTDVVQTGGFRIGNFADNVEVVNLVIGSSLEIGRSSRLGLAYATPLGGGTDQQFDGEFRLTYNWYPSNGKTRPDPVY